MTRKEALQRLRMLHLVAEDSEDKVAILMAIQALKHPEIIRCKDCKYCKEVGPGLFFCDSVDIVPVGQYVEPDGFCSMAKRKENWCSLCGKITNSKRCPNCGANLEVF